MSGREENQYRKQASLDYAISFEKSLTERDSNFKFEQKCEGMVAK